MINNTIRKYSTPLYKLLSSRIILARSLVVIEVLSFVFVLILSSLYPNEVIINKWELAYLFISSGSLLLALSFTELKNIDLIILIYACLSLIYTAFLYISSKFSTEVILILGSPLLLWMLYWDRPNYLAIYFTVAIGSELIVYYIGSFMMPHLPLVAGIWTVFISVVYYCTRLANNQHNLDLHKQIKDLSSKQYEADLILDSMSSVVSIKDENGVLVKANKEFSNFSGHPREELMGKTVFDFLPYEMATRYHDEDLKIIQKCCSCIQRQEAVENFKGELYWRKTTKLPYRNPISGFRGVLILAEDITALVNNTKRLEANETELKYYTAQLEETNRQLEESNKQLEMFAYAVSHDLREPLRTVMSFTQILKRRMEDKLTLELGEYMDFITQGAERMDLLVKGLLEYSRVGNKRTHSDVDVSIILEIVMKNLSCLIIDSNAEIIILDKLPMIRGNRIEISNVFQNLIHNAINYRSEASPQVKISYKLNEQFHEFSIADNGIGISQENYERIFEIFNRLHSYENIPGAGIGLSICKKVIEQHGGAIWVESNLNGGSTFYFTIPIAI